MSSNDTIVAASQADTTYKPSTTTFPAAEITAVLHEEFVSAVIAEADFLEVQLPDESHDVSKMAFETDSLTAIEILVAVEPIVGFELPSSVVKAGGYQSVDDAIEKLLPSIEKQWKKHNGVTT